MSFATWFQHQLAKPAVPMSRFRIAAPVQGRIGRPLTAEPLTAGSHYVRVRLGRMFLKYDATLFQAWFPAVSSHVKLQFGDDQIELPSLADAARVKLSTDKGADLVIRNVPLTPAVPFNGGMIELSAGLIAIRGANGAHDFIDVLSQFSQVLHVPQFSSMLAIAKPLMNGVDVLLNQAADRLHLGFFDSYGAGELSDGYVVVIREPVSAAKQARFRILDDELHVVDDKGELARYVDADYMLLRLEVFADRDDYESLAAIATPWDELQGVVAEQGADWERVAQTRLRALLLAIARSRELTRLDRIRISKEMRDRFATLKQDYAPALGKDSLGLQQTIANAPWPSADELEPTVDQLMEGL